MQQVASANGSIEKKSNWAFSLLLFHSYRLSFAVPESAKMGYSMYIRQGDNLLKRNRAVLLFGMLLYILSFLLTAIVDYSKPDDPLPLPGYFCATFPFSFWGGLLKGHFTEYSKPFSWALLAVPLINPVFLITAALPATNRNNRIRSTLRIALFFLFFIPIPVFYTLHLHPRIAYFLWMAAMLLVLFQKKLAAENWTEPQAKTIAG